MDKPVDSAQIVLDKRGPSPASGGGGAAAGKVWVALKVFGVAFVVCNVTALYVLHFVNRPSPTTRFTSEQFASTGGTKAAVGDVVSMGADNYLRNGAGTTAYVGLSSVEESGAAYIEYINIAKGGTTGGYQPVNLISYRCIHPAGGAANFSAITTVTVNTATKTVTVDGKYDSANKVADDAIRGIATLSDTRALVMTVDDSTYNYKTYLIPATISSTSVLLDQTKKSKVAEGSATQFITALSSTAALFTYYGAYAANADYFQFVKVAIVDSAGQITTSTAKQFGPANNDNTFMMTTFGKPVVLPSTDGAFVIPYYSAAWDASAKANDTGLCVTMATYTSSSNSIGAFTTGVCNTKYRPAYYPEGIMLSDNVLLLAIHDDANNNALTLTTLHVTATAAYFRSSYVFPEVAGAYNFGTQYAFSPEISLALLAGNRVVVSFLNPSMDGKQSVKVLQYSTSSLTFKDVTPVLPIAASDFTLDMKNGPSDRNKAVTHRVFPVSDDGVLAMHMGTRGLSAYNHAALVDVFGAPVGVLRDYDGKSKADVAISGKANDVNTFTDVDMVKGTTYYATSSGQVVSADSTTAFGAEYFQAKENPKLLVTADSKIGVALDDDTLFVSTSA